MIFFQWFEMMFFKSRWGHLNTSILTESQARCFPHKGSPKLFMTTNIILLSRRSYKRFRIWIQNEFGSSQTLFLPFPAYFIFRLPYSLYCPGPTNCSPRERWFAVCLVNLWTASWCSSIWCAFVWILFNLLRVMNCSVNYK